MRYLRHSRALGLILCAIYVIPAPWGQPCALFTSFPRPGANLVRYLRHSRALGPILCAIYVIPAPWGTILCAIYCIPVGCIICFFVTLSIPPFDSISCIFGVDAGVILKKQRAPARNADPNTTAVSQSCFSQNTRAPARNADPNTTAFYRSCFSEKTKAPARNGC